MTYCRRWPSQGQRTGDNSTINAGFYSRADQEFYQKLGVNWDLRVVNKSYEWVEKAVVFRPELRNWQSSVRDGLLEAGVDPYNGFSLVGTKIGGSTFDGSGRRHSAADLLNYENPVNKQVAVYASVERILLASSSPYSGSKQSAMKQLPMSYLLPPLLALFSFGT
jgi:mandelonitrile lyase